MKIGIVVAMVALPALAGCRGTGTDANNSGVADLSSNNSAFRGGASAPDVGNAATNSGTGVTGANGAVTVTENGASSRGKSGGNPANSGAGPSAPGTH